MNGKQIFALCVGIGGSVLLGSCIATGAPVAFGSAEFSSQAAGTGVSLGGLSGLIGMIYSVFTLLKSKIGAVKDIAGNDQIINGGLSILQSLTSGKTDAIGLTKHAAVAVIFADRAMQKDAEGMNLVMVLSKRMFDPPAQTPAPAPQVQHVPV